MTKKIYLFFIIFVLSLFAQPALADNFDLKIRLWPDKIDEQLIYASPLLRPDQKTFTHRQYQNITLNQELSLANFYYEIWNQDNRPIPEFKAKKLTTSEINLTKLDPSIYPEIRLVIFSPKKLNQPLQLKFDWQDNFDWRLAIFSLFTLSLILALIILSFYHRLTWKKLRAANDSLSLVWLIIIFSGLYGLVLGTFMGSWQILYVLIKMPLLLIGALAISFTTSYVLNLILGNQQTPGQALFQSLRTLMIISLVLASFSPLLWFFINVPQKHDIILVINLLFFGAAGLLGAKDLWQTGLKSKLGFLVWIFIYVLVMLQFAWLLRPWVGLLESPQQNIPFLRLYDGNVYTEVGQTIDRIINNNSI